MKIISKDNIRLIKDKSLNKKDYTDKKLYKLDSKTNLVPKKVNRLICIVFSEDKGAYFLLRKFDNKNDCFHFNNGLYLIDNEAIHITPNGNRICFYLEGISTPIKMSNIEKYEETIEYLNLLGEKKKVTVQKIKGLTYDSKILEIATDRKLAKNFTDITPEGRLIIIILILSIVSLVLSGIGIAISYVFRWKNER